MATNHRPAPTSESRNIFARVSVDLHRRLRIRAAEEDRSMAEVLVSAVKLYLSRPSESAPKLKK